jgi:hypothetical protein
MFELAAAAAAGGALRELALGVTALLPGERGRHDEGGCGQSYEQLHGFSPIWERNDAPIS